MAADKQLTVSEFLMWLEGVEEMQGDDWFPNDQQWQKIRQKINNIATAHNAPVQPVVYREAVVQHQDQNIPSREIPVQRAGGGLSNVQPVAQNMNPLFADAENPNSPVRTPNIDTSKGNGYTPAFV
jgi:hypothetical protein